MYLIEYHTQKKRARARLHMYLTYELAGPVHQALVVLLAPVPRVGCHEDARGLEHEAREVNELDNARGTPINDGGDALKNGATFG